MEFCCLSFTPSLRPNESTNLNIYAEIIKDAFYSWANYDFFKTKFWIVYSLIQRLSTVALRNDVYVLNSMAG